MLNRILRRVRRALVGGVPGPILSPAGHILGVAQASINPSARLYARPGRTGQQGTIRLGPGVYIGREAELATALGGDMVIGEDTSIQDRCVFHGDVEIGAHCLFGANGMMSTTTHRFRDQPAWLIRDQDAQVMESAEKPTDYSRPIQIEDDCWIGWGAALMPGVYVGRGAIIGANCVVTQDIGPYEIHGGVPNRLLSKRLDFSPPRSLSSAVDADLPYFYRGFRLRQEELARTRKAGIRAGLAHAMLILADGSKGAHIEGITLDTAEPLSLECRVNGLTAGRHQAGPGAFQLELKADAGQKLPLPRPLAHYTVIEIINTGMVELRGQDADPGRYAISTVGLL